MDVARSTPLSPASSTAITPAVVPSPPSPAVAPPPCQSDVLTTWPRSAQWATVLLLGVATALLVVRCLGSLRWGARPTALERGAALAYRIDLNQAKRAELLQLPGVGSSLADRIEAYRRVNGDFRSVEDLRKVPGIGPVTLDKLRPWVSVQAEDADEEMTPPAAVVPALRSAEKKPAAPARTKSAKEANLKEPIDINQASIVELQRLPGIGPKLSQRIVDERSKGRFKTVDELRRVSGIGPKTLDRLRPYITVGKEPAKVVAVD